MDYQKKLLKRYVIAGIFFVLTTGTLAHFVYGWTKQNMIAGLFSPINESVWEHMKLVFFPMLLFSGIMLWKNKKYLPCLLPSLCAGILAGTAAVPVLFYAYFYLLGQDVLILDLATFLLSVLLAFFIFYSSARSCQLRPYAFCLCILTITIFVCFLLFTYHPPSLGIFTEFAA